MVHILQSWDGLLEEMSVIVNPSESRVDSEEHSHQEEDDSEEVGTGEEVQDTWEGNEKEGWSGGGDSVDILLSDKGHVTEEGEDGYRFSQRSRSNFELRFLAFRNCEDSPIRFASTFVWDSESVFQED